MRKDANASPKEAGLAVDAAGWGDADRKGRRI